MSHTDPNDIKVETVSSTSLPSAPTFFQELHALPPTPADEKVVPLVPAPPEVEQFLREILALTCHRDTYHCIYTTGRYEFILLMGGEARRKYNTPTVVSQEALDAPTRERVRVALQKSLKPHAIIPDTKDTTWVVILTDVTHSKQLDVHGNIATVQDLRRHKDLPLVYKAEHNYIYAGHSADLDKSLETFKIFWTQEEVPKLKRCLDKPTVLRFYLNGAQGGWDVHPNVNLHPISYFRSPYLSMMGTAKMISKLKAWIQFPPTCGYEIMFATGPVYNLARTAVSTHRPSTFVDFVLPGIDSNQIEIWPTVVYQKDVAPREEAHEAPFHVEKRTQL